MPYQTMTDKFEAFGDWAKASGYSHCVISTEDLLWAVDRLKLLNDILGDDMDISETTLVEPAPIEIETITEETE